MIIAIDGPSGAGKSSVSKAVAKEISAHCLDTGAMYRAIAWHALEHGISLDDGEALGALARTTPIEFENEPGQASFKTVSIGGVDVTAAIRDARIDRSVSAVAAHPSVRAALVEQQRRIGQAGTYVVEGRDIGTVVFPHAEVKVFLTATNEERARRRVAQNEARGIGSTDFDEVLADIVRRDELDSARDASPLAAAADAVNIDSTAYTMDEVIAAIVKLAREAGVADAQPEAKR